jgi:hypothetical protein
VVVGGVVDVAPAPWPEAPVVPGLPVPLWPLPLLPIARPVVPLAVEPPEPIAELLLVSLPPVPVALHAANDSVITPLMRKPRTMFMMVSLE